MTRSFACSLYPQRRGASSRVPGASYSTPHVSSYVSDKYPYVCHITRRVALRAACSVDAIDLDRMTDTRGLLAEGARAGASCRRSRALIIQQPGSKRGYAAAGHAAGPPPPGPLVLRFCTSPSRRPRASSAGMGSLRSCPSAGAALVGSRSPLVGDMDSRWAACWSSVVP